MAAAASLFLLVSISIFSVGLLQLQISHQAHEWHRQQVLASAFSLIGIKGGGNSPTKGGGGGGGGGGAEGGAGGGGGGGGGGKLPAAQVSRRICQTEACRAAGLALYESINFTVNPCDDFFEFSCGNWIAKHPIPDDKSRIGTFGMLDDLLTEQMRLLLEDDPPNERKRRGAAAARDNNNNNADGSDKAKSIRFAKDLYRECMNREQIERLGIEPIMNWLLNILNTTVWPISPPNESSAISYQNGDGAKDSDWTQTFVRMYAAGHAPIVSFVVQPDANQTTTKRIYFDAASFGLGRKEYANQTNYDTTIAAYRKYMRDAARIMLQSTAGQNNNGIPIDEMELQARIDEIFKFEEQLALASTPQEERRTSKVWYNRMTLSDFRRLTNYGIDWTALIRRYVDGLDFGYEISDTDLVIVEDIPYYQRLTEILARTPPHIIRNYMGWIFVKLNAKYAGAELQTLAFEYQKAYQAVEKQQPIWKRCVKQVYAELSWSISRLYVDRILTPGTKQSARHLIAEIHAAFNQIVAEDRWLDETTRARALDKSTGIVSNVAYPDWILQDRELDAYYGFDDGHELANVTVRSGRYFDSVMLLNQFSMIKMYRELPKPVNLTVEWPMPPAMVNAAYSPTQNSITIPAAILKSPFFDPGWPIYLNLAAIGSVIGHEITHAFDDQGQEFDKHGNLENWWTEQTKDRFTEGAKCFIDQYGSIVDPDIQRNLNGVNTVGENIADNGGVRESYRAFRSLDASKKQALIPYMTKFSAEQLFFLSYANIWCGSTRTKYLQIMVDYDPHSPLKYRVNVPLSNFPEFSKAFQCPAGSRMNPSERCSLW